MTKRTATIAALVVALMVGTVTPASAASEIFWPYLADVPPPPARGPTAAEKRDLMAVGRAFTLTAMAQGCSQADALKMIQNEAGVLSALVYTKGRKVTEEIIQEHRSEIWWNCGAK